MGNEYGEFCTWMVHLGGLFGLFNACPFIHASYILFVALKGIIIIPRYMIGTWKARGQKMQSCSKLMVIVTKLVEWPHK